MSTSVWEYECIQNCQHIRQWCAQLTANWIIRIFGPIFPLTAVHSSLSPLLPLLEQQWSPSLQPHVHASAPITGCHLMMRAAYVLPTFTVSIIMPN